MKDKKLSKIIDVAIKREEEAYAFYIDLSENVDEKSAKDTIKWIAEEEKKHRAFLVKYRYGQLESDAFQRNDAIYYKIAEHQREPDIEKGMKSEHVYLVAAHRELKSYRFYTDLATFHPEGKTKDIILKMANEDLKHKEKMEYLYSNTAFPQTAGG